MPVRHCSTVSVLCFSWHRRRESPSSVTNATGMPTVVIRCLQRRYRCASRHHVWRISRAVIRTIVQARRSRYGHTARRYAAPHTNLAEGMVRSVYMRHERRECRPLRAMRYGELTEAIPRHHNANVHTTTIRRLRYARVVTPAIAAVSLNSVSSRGGGERCRPSLRHGKVRSSPSPAGHPEMFATPPSGATRNPPSIISTEPSASMVAL